MYKLFDYEPVDLVARNKDAIVSKFNDAEDKETLDILLSNKGLEALLEMDGISVITLPTTMFFQYVAVSIVSGKSNDEILEELENISSMLDDDESEDDSEKEKQLFVDILNARRNMESSDEYFCKVVDLLFEAYGDRIRGFFKKLINELKSVKYKFNITDHDEYEELVLYILTEASSKIKYSVNEKDKKIIDASASLFAKILKMTA